MAFRLVNQSRCKRQEFSENLALLSEEITFRSVLDLARSKLFRNVTNIYLIDISHLSMGYRSVWWFMIDQHQVTQLSMHSLHKFRSVEASTHLKWCVLIYVYQLCWSAYIMIIMYSNAMIYSMCMHTLSADMWYTVCKIRLWSNVSIC